MDEKKVERLIALWRRTSALRTFEEHEEMDRICDELLPSSEYIKRDNIGRAYYYGTMNERLPNGPFPRWIDMNEAEKEQWRICGMKVIPDNPVLPINPA